MIDENLKPWLIEVNGSPSLSATDEHDFELKKAMIGEVVDLVFSRKPTRAFHSIAEDGRVV